jgi:sulfite reductase (NADPH) hemoprotein beta-component
VYQPSEFDTKLLKERAVQFEGQLDRFNAGRTTADEFKPLRLQNGLYIQRHAPMLRIAIAYGMLNSTQIRKLGEISKKYDRNYGHLTTRQNMQLNWIEIDDVPKALKELAEVGLHGIQSSGNCLRNITSDAFAGISVDEILDPRPFAELLRQWSTFHPELSFLPRKFKVAFTGTPEDRALIQVHDLAFEAISNKPEATFRVRAGGGLGRIPVLGPIIRDELNWKDIRSYTHALMRVYNELGRRDNLTKARIKILIRTVGLDVFKSMVETEFMNLKNSADKLSNEDLEVIKDRFSDSKFLTTNSTLVNNPVTPKNSSEDEFKKWLTNNVFKHRINHLSAVLIPTKGIDRAPGDLSSDEMCKLADIADIFSHEMLRVTHTQDILLPMVKTNDLSDLYEKLKNNSLLNPVGGLLTDMVCCPGGDFCQLANARSIPLAEEISFRFKELDKLENLGPIDLRISGCMNSCGHHHIGHIGILGVDKGGASYYQLLLGGHSGHGAPAALGKIVGKSFAENEIADAIEEVLNFYVEIRYDGENFRETLIRLGHEPFIQAANHVRKFSEK